MAGVLACILLIGVGVGGTLAWLTAQTNDVVNTFTVGDINIELDETGAVNNAKEYDFVPGDVHSKDPYVTVNANSEACWVFVKVTETNNTATDLTGKVINWSVASGWNQVADQNVWYKAVAATTADSEPMYILAGDTEYPNGCVTVNTGVTKAMVEGLKENEPTLTFDAYAHQSDNTTVDVAIAAALAHWGLN